MKTLLRLAGLLVIPLALLLFAQWPLRELVQAWSREANDVAQILFALYAAVAVTAASVAGTHLSSSLQSLGHHTAPVTWKRIAVLCCVAPWALFILWSSAPQLWTSMAQFEKFPDTLNPGYFLIRFAGWLMVLLVLLEAVTRMVRKP